MSRAWQIHGVALVLWVALYFFLFWDALFPARKPTFDLDGFGAVLLGFFLGVYACVTTLVMVFVGRRPLVPLVIHGLALAAWGVGVVVEQEEKRERAEQVRERER